MDNKNIKIATSIPSLKDKIHVKVEEGSNTIYWYIKFNIPLDEHSVSEKHMSVTDTDGYIMHTDIAYDTDKNLIVISPLDSYEQNRFYLLNISKKVKSARGQNLKREIHILFKLLNNQISEYQILKSTVTVPKPKPRPKDYDQRNPKSKVYSFDQKIVSSLPQDKLPQAAVKVNVLLGIAGLATALSGLFFSNLPLMGVGILACILGVAHIFYQLSRKTQYSVLVYNKGVRLFNKEHYEEAEQRFKMALAIDPDNEMAEYALDKVYFYNS